MDYVLELADHYFLDKTWASLVPIAAFSETLLLHPSIAGNQTISHSPWLQLVSHLPHPPIDEFSSSTLIESASAWPRTYLPRQLISLCSITLIGIYLLYFATATFSYYAIFNHEMMRHPRFLKNQVRLEITTSVKAFPGMMVLTLPWFQAEVMGYSKLYDGIDTYGWAYFLISIPLFLLITDYLIYWIHRLLHLPSLYKALHKPHHKWIIPTPFSSYAFHPVDGYLQSLPYHLFVFIFPMNRMLYLSLFVAVTLWTVFIHDSDMITGHPLETIINGPAHHTLHHLYFTVNYGQYFTWADRVGGSYRQPMSELDPLLEIQAKGDKLKEQ